MNRLRRDYQLNISKLRWRGFDKTYEIKQVTSCLSSQHETKGDKLCSCWARFHFKFSSASQIHFLERNLKISQFQEASFLLFSCQLHSYKLINLSETEHGLMSFRTLKNCICKRRVQEWKEHMKISSEREEIKLSALRWDKCFIVCAFDALKVWIMQKDFMELVTQLTSNHSHSTSNKISQVNFFFLVKLSEHHSSCVIKFVKSSFWIKPRQSSQASRLILRNLFPLDWDLLFQFTQVFILPSSFFAAHNFVLLNTYFEPFR